MLKIFGLLFFWFRVLFKNYPRKTLFIGQKSPFLTLNDPTRIFISSYRTDIKKIRDQNFKALEKTILRKKNFSIRITQLLNFCPQGIWKMYSSNKAYKTLPRACKPDISSHIYRIDLKFWEKLKKGQILKDKQFVFENSIWVALESIFWSYLADLAARG